MALAPKYAAQAIAAGHGSHAVHTVELYLDYVCPYSAKMWATLSSSVFPALAQRYDSKVRFILRQQIQPWHPSSTLTHEAAAAVLRVAPAHYVAFSTKLFERQKEYFDVNVVNETRNQTYARLAKLAGEVSAEAGTEKEVLELLTVSDKPAQDGSLNVGNGVTNDMKFMVKYNRRVGVHVTPTVLFNGIEEGGISSGFSGEQWEEWLQKNVV